MLLISNFLSFPNDNLYYAKLTILIAWNLCSKVGSFELYSSFPKWKKWANKTLADGCFFFLQFWFWCVLAKKKRRREFRWWVIITMSRSVFSPYSDKGNYNKWTLWGVQFQSKYRHTYTDTHTYMKQTQQTITRNI